jgi:hypothetical protein
MKFYQLLVLTDNQKSFNNKNLFNFLKFADLDYFNKLIIP